MKDRVFSSFPAEGLKFLRSLKRNNNRDYFQEHKSIYESAVRRPILDLIASLAVDFQEFAPEMVASPKASAYRIYRDTRFSKDKSPYKTHAAAVFPRSGLGKHEGAGFYLHISPSEVLIGGGLYMPLSEDLTAVREAIAANWAEFKGIVESRLFRKMFEELRGERLARVPRGFAADHPAAEYLKFKQFLAARTLPPTAALERTFYRTVVETFRALHPLIRFLNEPIVRLRRARDRQQDLLKAVSLGR